MKTLFQFNLFVILLNLCLFPVSGQSNSADGYEVYRNIPYVDNPHLEQFLDFYWPKGKARGTVVFIHGGSLSQSGDRRTSEIYKNVCVPLVENGIGCANIDYRLAPEFKWPTMPKDVAQAIVKVRELIEKEGGDPDNLFLFGHSSGCTLAAIVGTDSTYLKSVGLNQSHIKGIIPMGCILDNRDAALRKVEPTTEAREKYRRSSSARTFPTLDDWMSANPSFHVSPSTPPTLVILAKEERFAPPILEQGARFVRLLKQRYQVDADIVIVPGKHFSSIRDFTQPDNPTFLLVKEFVEKYQGN